MTVITESFNKADSTTVGPDLTWTEVSGPWEVSGNKLILNENVGGLRLIRAESDLAGVDQYAQCIIGSSINGQAAAAGPAVRVSSVAETYYALQMYAGATIYLMKMIAGSNTYIASVGVTQNLPELYRIEVTGNPAVITCYQAGVLRLTYTDSSSPITSGTRCGIFGYANSAIPNVDSFEAGDLGASNPVTVMPGVLSLSLSVFAPTVVLPIVVTPDTKSLTTSAFAPTVVLPVICSPGVKTLATSSFVPTIAKSADITSNLELHWPLDDGSGSTAVDTSGHSHTADCPSVTWTTGKIGGGINIGAFAVRTNDDLADSGDSWTLSLWIKASDIPEDIICNDGSDVDLFWTSDGIYYDDGSVATTPVPLAADGAFHQVVFVANYGVGMKVYIDGVYVANGPSPLFVTSPWSGGINFFTVVLDDVRFYKRALYDNGVALDSTAGSDIGTLFATGNSSLVIPGVANLAVSTYAPTVGLPIVCTPGVKTLVLTEYAPTVVLPVIVSPNVISLTIGTFAPTTVLPIVCSIGVQNLALTEYAPTVVLPVVVTPGVSNLSLSTFAPTSAVSIISSPSTLNLATTSYAPTIVLPVVCTPGMDNLVVTTYAPSAIVPGIIAPSTANLVISSFAPTIVNPNSSIPGTGSLIVATFAPTINLPKVAIPGTNNLLIVTYPPYIPGMGGLQIITVFYNRMMRG